MASTSLQLISSDPNAKTSTLSITNVEPTSTSAQAVQFTQKLNALTKNSYERTNRIDKINCDTEPVPGGVKPTPTLTLSHYTATVTDLVAASSILNSPRKVVVTTNSDGEIYVANNNFVDTDDYGASAGLNVTYLTKNNERFVGLTATATTQACTLTIGTLETDNFAASAATFTITAS